MNKKMMITILVILISGLIVLSSVYSYNLIKNSQNHFSTINLRRLALTNEQKEKVEKILSMLKDKTEEIFKKINEANRKEKSIISKEKFNLNELENLLDLQIKNLISISNLKKDAYLKIVSLLNSEQRKRFPTFVEFTFVNLKTLKLDFLLEKLKNLNMKSRNFFTDEQIEKIKSLFINKKEYEKVILEKIKENIQKQKEVLKSKDFNEESLKNLINDYILLENDILLLRKSFYLDYLNLLNPKQRKNSPTSLFFFKLF